MRKRVREERLENGRYLKVEKAVSSTSLMRRFECFCHIEDKVTQVTKTLSLTFSRFISQRLYKR
jgi:hypothetical protein